MNAHTPLPRSNGVSKHGHTLKPAASGLHIPPDNSQILDTSDISIGKTAPRLIHDALLLDPGLLAPTSFDILAQPPPLFNHGPRSLELTPETACRHDYALRASQCRSPPRDYKATPDDQFSIKLVCRQCRINLHVAIHYHPDGRRPCPNLDFPLHHLVLCSAPHEGEYDFACSAPDCKAIVTFRYGSSIITDADVKLLTDPLLLRTRYEHAIQSNADRQGFILATPVSTLWKLRRYVRDTLRSDTAGKRIPMLNKRYLESFGPETHAIFERVGFTRGNEDGEEFWALPQLSVDAYSPQRVYLESWDIELQALIESLATRHGEPNPDPLFIWIPARIELDRLLAAQNYSRSLQSRMDDSGAVQDHPYYASLGAMRDFSDELLAFAFDRQYLCDPQNGPYYFDCLQDLAGGRESESLLMKASLLESEGVVGQKTVNQAYQYFNLQHDARWSDEHIINVYRSRLQDTSPSNHHEVRSKLKILAAFRNSQLLTDAASNTIETYQQALSWLGAEEGYPDDSILTLYTAKLADSPSDINLARRAVQIIADHRNSDPLHSWLSTGEMRESDMSVDDACKHLKIKLDTVDDTTLQMVIDGAKKDNPGWRTEQAIEVVKRAYRQSGSVASTQDFSHWPVGLTSHGNTCYLNSLLQYYFTIKPLRDLVLNFDDYRFNLSQQGEKSQRVGARKVTPLEIRAYQKFVEDLRHLFIRMIKDPGPAVKPDADLVCRAFLKAEDTEDQHSSVSRPSSPAVLIEVAGQPPARPPQPVVEMNQAERAPSVASSMTLAEVDNVAPDTMITSQILPDTPPGTPPFDDKTGTVDSIGLRVPSLPPRSTTPVRQQTNLVKAEEAARQQQDVTEVMDEILFRLRCAVRADGQDSREEQLDAFRSIFYMRISDKTLGEDGKVKSKEEYAMNILLNIPSRPTDIYSALDEIFELQTIDYGTHKIRQYRTIQEHPPILQINIPRNTYDRATGRGVKVEYKVHLEETLFLDRYFEWEDEAVLRRRQETWGWRQQLEVLQAQRDVINRDPIGLEGPAKLKAVAKYLRNLRACNEAVEELGLPSFEIDDAIANNLEAVAEAQQTQLGLISEQIASLQTRIAHSFAGMEQLRYRLAAVFFHRGGYGHGHYWSCIFDFTNSMWRIYNDEKVEKFDKVTDISDAETWQQGTPTYAVYVRDEVKEEYIQPICRDVEQATQSVGAVEAAGPVDEVMMDVDAPPLPPKPPRS